MLDTDLQRSLREASDTVNNLTKALASNAPRPRASTHHYSQDVRAASGFLSFDDSQISPIRPQRPQEAPQEPLQEEPLLASVTELEGQLGTLMTHLTDYKSNLEQPAASSLQARLSYLEQANSHFHNEVALLAQALAEKDQTLQQLQEQNASLARRLQEYEEAQAHRQLLNKQQEAVWAQMSTEIDSQQYIIADLQALLDVADPYDLVPTVCELVEAQPAQQLVDKLGALLVKLAPPQTFGQRPPTPKQILHWVTSLVRKYMALKKAVDSRKTS